MYRIGLNGGETLCPIAVDVDNVAAGSTGWRTPGLRLWQVRKEIFGDNFPGSAIVTLTALANPDAKIEIQGFAVIGSK